MAHLFNLLLCLRGKWKDKLTGFIRQRRFIDDRRVRYRDRDTATHRAVHQIDMFRSSAFFSNRKFKIGIDSIKDLSFVHIIVVLQ